jgi:WhiB family transcriptional regulator, redox-sensing transcriptional regulator
VQRLHQGPRQEAIRFELAVEGVEVVKKPGIHRSGKISGSAYEDIPAPGRWVEHGVCKGRSPEWVNAVFFPARGDVSRHQTAMDLCASCPVVDPCRMYAIANPKVKGIWGGLSEQQRRDIRSRNRKAREAARRATGDDTGRDARRLYGVLEELALYPIGTRAEVGRGDSGLLGQVVDQLRAKHWPLPPGVWEFDAEEAGGHEVLFACLQERDLSRVAPDPLRTPTRVGARSDELEDFEDELDDEELSIS